MNVYDYFFENTSALDKLLVLGNRETITYHQAYEKSFSLACHLHHLVNSGNNILLLSENSVFFIVAYLAVFKSGNVCVPLNPASDSSALKKILHETDSPLILVSKRFRKKADELSSKTLDEDAIAGVLTEKNITIPDEFYEAFDQEQLAEIIYTSGSTGIQKGVMLSHKNIIANTTSIIEYLNLSNKDVMEVVMPFYYCYGLSLLHTHLRCGGSVVLNNSFIFIGSVINDLIRYNCTGFAGVPSHFQILLRKTKDFKSTVFPSLRYVTQAGGKLHNVFIEEFTQAFSEVKFYVMYGQTEATARLSYLPPDLLPVKMGSIGRGIPGVSLRVVNSDGKDIEIGETGEIIARGDNIMVGYFNDEEATHQAIKDGWLYTGDIASIDEDGFLYIQSRIKEIIKVRGIRISPKEIEAVIVTFPGVIDCSIDAVEDEVSGEALKATVYINEADTNLYSDSAVRKLCSERLEPYKVPQIVEFRSDLAFNASGKKSKF